MARKKKGTYSSDDIQFAEERYRKTKDPMYLVFAVGRRPHHPPLWAMREIFKLYRMTSKLAAASVSEWRVGQIMDNVIRYKICHAGDASISNGGYLPLDYKSPSMREAIDKALEAAGHSRNETSNRSIRRSFKAEARGCEDFDEITELSMTERFYRVSQEIFDKTKNTRITDHSWMLYFCGDPCPDIM